MSVWINTKDRMPPLNKAVLILYKDRFTDLKRENLRYSIAQRVVDNITGEERWSYFIEGLRHYEIVYWTPLVDMPRIVKRKGD